MRTREVSFTSRWPAWCGTCPLGRDSWAWLLESPLFGSIGESDREETESTRRVRTVFPSVSHSGENGMRVKESGQTSHPEETGHVLQAQSLIVQSESLTDNTEY